MLSPRRRPHDASRRHAAARRREAHDPRRRAVLARSSAPGSTASSPACCRSTPRPVPRRSTARCRTPRPRRWPARTTARPGTMRPCRSTSACSSPRASRCRASCSPPWRSRTAASAATCARPIPRPSPTGTETKLNLCVPGGKETSRMLKRLLEETPAPAAAAATPRPGAAPTRQRRSAERGTRDAPGRGHLPLATRLNGKGSEKDTRHVVLDIAGSGLAYAPGDSFGLYPEERSGARRCRARRPARAARFPGRRQAHPRRADRGLRARRPRPTCCSS